MAHNSCAVVWCYDKMVFYSGLLRMLNRQWIKCKNGYDPILRKGVNSPWDMLGAMQYNVCTLNMPDMFDMGVVVDIIGILIERGYGRWYDTEYQFNARMRMMLRSYTDGNFSAYDGDVREALECWYWSGPVTIE